MFMSLTVLVFWLCNVPYDVCSTVFSLSSRDVTLAIAIARCPAADERSACNSPMRRRAPRPERCRCQKRLRAATH